MEIEIEIVREDYADFNRYYYLKKGFLKRIYIILVSAFIISAVIYREPEFHLGFYLTKVVLSGLIFGLIYIGGLYLGLSFTKLLPAAKGGILGKKRFTITEEGLVEDSHVNRNIQRWHGIKSIELNDNAIFVFVDNIAAYIIPKRYFKNERAMEAFVGLMRQKIEVSS